MTGLSKSTISKIMDESSNPTIGTLEQLAKGLKINITDLFESNYQKVSTIMDDSKHFR